MGDDEVLADAHGFLGVRVDDLPEPPRPSGTIQVAPGCARAIRFTAGLSKWS
jgi:hypothetical protein